MKFKFYKSRLNYKPILIVIHGDFFDPYESIRNENYVEKIRTPIKIAIFTQAEIYEAYNESKWFCIDQGIEYCIFVHHTIFPNCDWSYKLRDKKYRKIDMIYYDEFMNFTILNIGKIKKYGDFKLKDGNPSDLHNFLFQKLSSDGKSVRKLNEIEEKWIGDNNERR